MNLKDKLLEYSTDIFGWNNLNIDSDIDLIKVEVALKIAEEYTKEQLLKQRKLISELFLQYSDIYDIKYKDNFDKFRIAALLERDSVYINT